MKGPWAALLAFVVVSCAGPTETATPSPAETVATSATIVTSASGRAFSLLANNHLLIADIGSGAVLAELLLATPASPISEVHALAFAQNNQTLFALVNEASGRPLVAAVDATTLKVAATFDPGAGLAYRGLAVGPRSGLLYLFGNQGGDAVVRVVDPSGRQAMQTWPARTSSGRNWLIYQGAVASDESALYLSYHGPDTTGIDRFAIQVGGLLRCGDPYRRDGRVAPDRVRFDDRSRAWSVRPQLAGNHLMEFAIAAGVNRLYAVGSCGYAGGLAAADLARHQTEVLAPPRTLDVVCGEGIEALRNGALLVVAKTAAPVPSLSPGGLVVLTIEGKMLRTIKTSAEPIDLLLV